MSKYSYLASTVCYGIVGVSSVISSTYFIFQKEYLLSLILLLMFLVCLDNFFCTDRMCKAGYPGVGHWSIPPLFKK